MRACAGSKVYGAASQRQRRPSLDACLMELHLGRAGAQLLLSPAAASLLYESPFTDVSPRGPDGLFTSAQVEELIVVLDRVRATALAA
jgi:hypothetical protein